MAANMGAHEVMELHEILSGAIDGINQIQLILPHVRDGQLRNICINQLRFMNDEYNAMVRMLNQQGAGEAAPYRSPRNQAPVYGLDHPAPQTPNAGPEEIDDRDVASILLSIHKAGAAKKMIAALEIANPAIRRFVQQSAVNCAEQAYEVWQFMNQMGWYQVPTMKQITTDTMLHTYQPGSADAANAGYGAWPQ